MDSTVTCCFCLHTQVRMYPIFCTNTFAETATHLHINPANTFLQDFALLYTAQVTYVFLRTCRIGNPWIPTWPSAGIHEVSADGLRRPHGTSQSIRRHCAKIPWTLHKASMESLRRICGSKVPRSLTPRFHD